MSTHVTEPGSQTGAGLLVKSLEAQGVEYVFGVPGAKIDKVFDTLLDSPIKTIVCRHEQNAAFIAGGVGRMTGKAGVALVTSRPGCSNLVTGLATANSERDPVVAIAVRGDAPARREPSLRDEKHEPRKEQGRVDVVHRGSMQRPLNEGNKEGWHEAKRRYDKAHHSHDLVELAPTIGRLGCENARHRPASRGRGIDLSRYLEGPEKSPLAAASRGVQSSRSSVSAGPLRRHSCGGVEVNVMARMRRKAINQNRYTS